MILSHPGLFFPSPDTLQPHQTWTCLRALLLAGLPAQKALPSDLPEIGSFSLFRSRLRCHLLRQAYPEYPNLMYPTSQLLSYYLVFGALIGIWNCLINVDLFSHLNITHTHTLTHCHSISSVTAKALSLLFTTMSPAPRTVHVVAVL